MSRPPPQDRYATNLQLDLGYPLRIPEPIQNPDETQPRDLRIGDVGYVDRDGKFNYQFNIRFSPPNELPQNCFRYEPIHIDEPGRTNPNKLERNKVFMGGVRQDLKQDDSNVNKPRSTYEFTAMSDKGAILILPSGAALLDLQDGAKLKEVEELAWKHAGDWCEQAGRKSLYLITGMYKTKEWTLGAFHKGWKDGIISVKRRDDGTWDWSQTAFEVDFRGGPVQENSTENHTIIIKGFKMTMRQLLTSPVPEVQWVSAQPQTWINLLLQSSFPCIRRFASVGEIPWLSQPRDTLDLINSYLLSKDPDAKMAITHDNLWINMLEKEELKPSELTQEDSIRRVLDEKYEWYTEDEIVRLRSPRSAFPQVMFTMLPDSKDTCGAHYEQESSQLIPDGDICAENVTVGLGRVPVGFYVQVDSRGEPSRRTQVKSVRLYDSTIQWDDRIQLPSDTAAAVTLTLFASYEFSPMLGKGERLRELVETVGELLDQTEQPFGFAEGEAVSPCSSLLIVVQRWHCNEWILASSPVVRTSHSEDTATDLGREALHRYRKSHDKTDLDSAMEHFYHALTKCTDEGRAAAALFNLATAKFVAYQSHGVLTDFDTSISTYKKALERRGTSHPDRSGTLLHLSQALLYHYGFVGSDESNGKLQEYIQVLMNTCPNDTHEHQAASLLYQTYQWLQLKDSHDPDQLREFISKTEGIAESLPATYFDRPVCFNNLGLALLRRFRLRREAGDLDQAINWLEKAVMYTPDSHLDKYRYISDLNNALLARFQRQGVANSTRQPAHSRMLHDFHPRATVTAQLCERSRSITPTLPAETLQFRGLNV